MATKLLELELTENIKPIVFEKDYDHYRLLIRSKKKPLGWISFTKNATGSVSADKIRNSIAQQLGSNLIHEALFRSFSIQEGKVTNEGISVIVCTRNRTEQLATCLQTLLSLNYPDYEIIVVDNAPSDNRTQELASNLPIRYVRENRPGLDRARNRGIEEAQYDLVAFTDDDVRVDAYWLQAIAKVFSNKEIMGASGYVAPAELETSAQHLFELDYGGMGHGFTSRTYKKEALTTKQLLWASGFGIGANMAFRKEVFEKIGSFNTALDVGTPSHGGGDVEMFHRLVNKGYYFAYEPSMLVWHFHRRGNRALQKQVFDNGRSFGCYLIDCFLKKTVRRFSIIEFFLVDWLLKWNLKNLFSRHTKIPRRLVVMELYGMLTSPTAYWKTKQWDQKISKRYSS